MGQTWVNPTAQVMFWLCMGQLQLQSHLPLPSGQSHLQEHSIPSPDSEPDPDPEPVGGAEPDPEPVGGIEPDPEPVGGIEPDPEPVGGIEPDPEPVGGTDPDPEPVGGMAVVVAAAAASNFPFVILTFPFWTLISKVKTPESPSSLIFF